MSSLRVLPYRLVTRSHSVRLSTIFEAGASVPSGKIDHSVMAVLHLHRRGTRNRRPRRPIGAEGQCTCLYKRGVTFFKDFELVRINLRHNII